VKARLATAGAGPVPLRLRAAEEILEGEEAGDAAIEAAARKASELVEPDSDIHASADYRRHLAGVLTGRALRRAMAKVRSASRGAAELPAVRGEASGGEPSGDMAR